MSARSFAGTGSLRAATLIRAGFALSSVHSNRIITNEERSVIQHL